MDLTIEQFEPNGDSNQTMGESRRKLTYRVYLTVGWVWTHKRPQFPPDSLVASRNKVLRDTSWRGLTG